MSNSRLVRYGLYYELEQDYINYALHFSLWNYKTIQGEKKKELYRMLKRKWFRELGIAGRGKEYFYNKKHQTVDIIKLNGSVELGPIVGLSDVIVDIVETGGTLKENGLGVLEEVCPLSARMIVNPVSMRMEYERISRLIHRLKEVCV